MMEELIKSVQSLVADEYARASKQWGPLAASGHEGYALIKEELEEAQVDMETLEQRLGHFWMVVKSDEVRFHRHYLDEIGNTAVLAACELIQVAAMATKTLAWVKKEQEEQHNEKTAEKHG